MGLLRCPTAMLGGLPHQLGLGGGDINLNAAANRAGYRFMVNEAKTLSSLQIYADSISGSPTGGCEIFAMGANGNPTGSALADSTTHSPNPITAGTLTFSGYSLALTAGAWYVAVFRNTHATPASNSYRVVFSQTGGLPLVGFGVGAAFGWAVVSSTDSGSSYTGAGTGTTSLTLIFDDASRAGWPYRGQWNTGTADGIYGTRELGNRMTTPAGAVLRAIGIVVNTRTPTGSPTGSLRGRIRLASDNSILGTTYDYAPIITIGGNLRAAFHFGTVVELQPSTEYDFLVGETTQSDTSGNRYNFEGTTIPTGSPGEIPGAMRKVYFDASTWAVTQTQYVHLAVLLDEQPSVAGAGGGGGGATRTLFMGAGVR